jgi:L-serine/L-threonine ammonia-lyase
MKGPTLYIQTPVYTNPEIDSALGKTIYLKMECYQPVGSFKARGIGAICQEAVTSRAQHLVSSSGGNAGYAAAYAGRQLGVEVTVVVPESTSQMARRRIESEGAQLVVRGAAWDEANEYAQHLVGEVGGAFIPPFDHPTIWQGNATLIDEAAHQIPKPDAVVLSVGGGGLLCGVLEGLHRNGWPDVPVIAVETEGAASLAASLAQGELVTLPAITSIATTLGARRVTARALEWASQHPIVPHVVTDSDAVRACLWFADKQRVVVEPACGASLSLLLEPHRHVLDRFQSILVIVCGGAGITVGQLLQWSDQPPESS